MSQQNARECRRGIHKWTIQRNWQHKTKNTQLGKFALLDNVAHQLLKINVLVII